MGTTDTPKVEGAATPATDDCGRSTRQRRTGEAAIFLVVASPMILASYLATWKLGDWLCDRFFTVHVRTAETTSKYVSDLGNYVSLALLILPTALWISAIVDVCKAPPSVAREADTSQACMDPGKSTDYVLRRSASIVGFVLIWMVYAFFSGRMVRWITGSTFLPSNREAMGVGTMSLVFLYMLSRKAWWWANEEVEHQRRGDPVRFDLAVLIHSLVPYAITFLIAGLTAQGLGGGSQVPGAGTLFFLFLLYLGYQAIARPITNWVSEKNTRDRLFGRMPSARPSGEPEQQEQPRRRD